MQLSNFILGDFFRIFVGFSEYMIFRTTADEFKIDAVKY